MTSNKKSSYSVAPTRLVYRTGLRNLGDVEDQAQVWRSGGLIRTWD